ncbi:MAG TPA: di-heme oxidoredictase family protein, partial [Candidatus Binatia bacterium]|nr:di-heme oxidoredictase family protein [Candidatus Binatia bacterium]
MTAKAVGGALVFLSLWVCGCKTPKPPELGDPVADLTADQHAEFLEGKKVFQRVFTPSHGLGPLFNQNSCAECHEKPVLGGVGDEVEVHATRFVAPNSCDPLFQEGGPVIQQKATPLLRAKGIDKEQIPPHATSQAHRSTPALFGLGLVDAIQETTLLSHEDPHDANGDGIAGRANRTIDGRVGRFGRKAAVATLFDFNSGAFPQEMGVTTPLSPVEETINGVPVPPDTDPASDPEITM